MKPTITHQPQQHRFDAERVEMRHDGAAVVEQTFDVGEEQQLLRAVRDRDRRGRGIRVDVEQRAVYADGNG